MRDRVLLSFAINADENTGARARFDQGFDAEELPLSTLGGCDQTSRYSTDPRNRDGPAEFLKNYRGYLHWMHTLRLQKSWSRRDESVGCWAHCAPRVL